MNVSPEYINLRNFIVRNLKANASEAVDRLTAKILMLQDQVANYKKLADSIEYKRFKGRPTKKKMDFEHYFIFKGEWTKLDIPAEYTAMSFIRILRNKIIYCDCPKLYFTQYLGEVYAHKVPWDHPHSRAFKLFADKLGLK